MTVPTTGNDTPSGQAASSETSNEGGPLPVAEGGPLPVAEGGPLPVAEGGPLPVAEGTPVAVGEGGRTRRRPHAALVVVGAIAAIAGTVGLGILLYACSIHTIPGDSDGATVVVEGAAYNHGNFLLHGWGLSLDSFWAVDAVVYGILVALVKMRPALLYAGPAVIATAVIVVGVLMAREGRRGAAGLAGGVTIVALLGLPTHTLAYFFLRGPLHIGTALWGLIAFAGLRRGRFGVGWVVAVIFLAAGMLGDLQAVAYAVIPVGLAGVVATFRERDFRAGSAQISAAAAAVVLDETIKKVRTSLGGFSIGATNPIAPHHQLLVNVKHVLTYGSEFYGLRRSLFPATGVPTWLQMVHGAGAVLVAVTFLGGLALLIRGVIAGNKPAAASADDAQAPSRWKGSHSKTPAPAQLWRLDDMLTIAVFGPAGAFCVLAVNSDPQYTRYLTASVIFAAILAGRMVARAWPHLRKGLAARTVASIGLALTLTFASGVGYMLDQPDPGQSAGVLVAWLHDHGIDDAVSDYWSSNIATVQSKGAVTLRPVVGTGGYIHRYIKQSASSWYAGVDFRCFVWNTQLAWGNDNTKTAIHTWGTPASITKVGVYWVLIWKHPFTLNPNPPSVR